MENEVQLHEEEVVNPEQFQVGRNAQDGQSGNNRNGRNDQDQKGYTPGETEYADGEGTGLDQGIEGLEDDNQERDLDQQNTDLKGADLEDTEKNQEEDSV